MTHPDARYDGKDVEEYSDGNLDITALEWGVAEGDIFTVVRRDSNLVLWCVEGKSAEEQACDNQSKLPANWGSAVNQTGQKQRYYYHKVTGFSTWEFPSEKIIAREATKFNNDLPGGGSGDALPPTDEEEEALPTCTWWITADTKVGGTMGWDMLDWQLKNDPPPSPRRRVCVLQANDV